MRFGVYLPNFGAEASPSALADVAQEAEAAGWDGFFIWDHILFSKSEKMVLVEPWIALAAAAERTKRIRIGATVTPLARRRPWVLARQTVSLDSLSDGRLTLGVGLGEPADADFGFFGEETNPKIRAQMLDEGLDILNGLWSGDRFSYQGAHYQLEEMTFLPTPVQEPRIPVWVGGFWPNKAPFRRAARWDGIIPLKKDGWVGPEDVKEILSFIHQHRTTDAPFDVAVIASMPPFGKDEASQKEIAKLEESGVTWMLMAFYEERNSAQALLEAVRQGPPKPVIKQS